MKKTRNIKNRFKPSKRAMEVEYAIRDVLIPAGELEKKGTELMKLDIGDPDKFDFDTPEHMKKALYEAILGGHNGYASSQGDEELREAISEDEKEKGADVDASDVIITNGVTESIQLLFGAVLNRGDEVLVPGPGYPPYTSITKFLGGKPVPYRTVEEEGWIPDVENLKAKITGKTRMVVVINPNNPTGALYPRKILEEIVNISFDEEILLVSDEVYDRLIYEGTFYSPTMLAKDLPMVIFNGMSKVYLAPGWRIGYTVFVNPNGELDEIKEAFLKQARLRICANTPCQRASVAALKGPQSYMEEVVSKLRERRNYIHKRINEIEGLSASKPQGALYIFPKIEARKWSEDKKFVLDVLNKAHVVLVPGSGFCPVYGKKHFRAVFLPPIDVLEKTLNALESFMKKELH